MAGFIENMRQALSSAIDKGLGNDNVYHRSSGKTQKEYENDLKTLQALEKGTKISATIDAMALGAALGGSAGANILGKGPLPFLTNAPRGGLMAPGTGAIIGGGLGALAGLGAANPGEGKVTGTVKNTEEPKKEEKKKEEENPDDFVTFYYVPGDTFGQKILDLGIGTDNGLWGDNGDVNFYTQQLIDGGYLDANGNVKLGVPIKLKKRK